MAKKITHTNKGLCCKILFYNYSFIIAISFLIFYSLQANSQTPSFQDKSIIAKVEQKVIHYYQSKNSLNYNFIQTFYTSQNSKALVSKGTVCVLKENDSVYYRGIHTYDDFPDMKFESVKNKNYFGVNNSKSKYFNDYSALPEKKRFYTFHNSPNDILKPNAFLKTIFEMPSYHTSLSIGPDHYKLQMTDTNIYVNEIAQTYKRILVYYISKKDYRIVKHSSHTFWTSGDLQKNDSVVYTFTYSDQDFQKTKMYVESFVPFSGKKIVPLPPPKDSLKVFPEFHLPDSSGTFQEIRSDYILIDFWYKACGPCLANMKVLDRINCKNVNVVLINIKDSLDADIRKIMSKHSFTFLFNGQELNKELKLNAYPTTYLLDKNRNIIYKHIGYGDTEKLDDLLINLCSE